MEKFFIVTNTAKDKDLVFTKSIIDYLESRERLVIRRQERL